MIIPKYGMTSKPFKLGHKEPKVDQAKLIQQMLNEGKRPMEIADSLGLKRNTVYVIIRNYGLTI